MQGKLDKAVVLYYPAELIGDDTGARCGGCMMFVRESHDTGHCTVVEGKIDGAVGICGLYVHGKHSGPSMKGMTSKDVAGYIEDGPTHCGNCMYYQGDKNDGSCHKVRGTVEFHGCCNYWEEAGSHQ